MVIDTSALLALLLDEPEASAVSRAVAADPRRLMSAFTALETAVVIEAKKEEAAGREFDLLVHKAALDIVPMDAGQVELARSAWRRYGKGRHPAGLNVGDCCSYALARFTGEPLLFTGDDFAKTDVHRVPETEPSGGDAP
jgi:ribonuclease VapC